MRRVVLFVLVLAAFGVPSAAHAAVPCRDRIYNDWYVDGKIATSYPIACYRDALKHIPPDAQIYSNLSQDIHSAMQAALAAEHGKTVPAEVGKGEKTKSQAKGSHAVNQQQTVASPTSSTPDSSTTIAASETSSSGSSGLPLPIIVLGALAILLAAVGAAGAGVRYFRNRGPSV
jgi:hypothetical protein